MHHTTTLTEPAFAKIPGISHAFLTRAAPGTHVYTSLDAQKARLGDDATHVVVQNLSSAQAHCGFAPSDISMMIQSHSARVALVDAQNCHVEHDADAQVTKTPGIALGVLTADCVPILLADNSNKVIGVVHAGWKGAMGGVVEACLASMKAEGASPQTTRAVIGPCIRWDSYEVGPEFLQNFAHLPHHTDYFKPSSREGHFLFNLPGLVRQVLLDAGVSQVFDLGLDTYSHPETCFSYRRLTHQSKGTFEGNMLSLVMLNL